MGVAMIYNVAKKIEIERLQIEFAYIWADNVTLWNHNHTHKNEDTTLGNKPYHHSGE